MPNVRGVSFTLPEQQDVSQLDRMQKLVTALIGQGGLQQPETQTVPGYPLPWVVKPSPLEYVGKLANQGVAIYGEKQAEKKQKQTIADENAKMAEALRAYQQTGDPQALMGAAQTQPMAMDLMIKQAQLAQALKAFGGGGAPGDVTTPQSGVPGMPTTEQWLTADTLGMGKEMLKQRADVAVERQKPAWAAPYAPPVQIQTPNGPITAFAPEFEDVRRAMAAQALSRPQQPEPAEPQASAPLPPAMPGAGGPPNLARPAPGVPVPQVPSPPMAPGGPPPVRPMQGPGPPGQMPRSWAGQITMPTPGGPVPAGIGAPQLPPAGQMPQQPQPLPPVIPPGPAPGIPAAAAPPMSMPPQGQAPQAPVAQPPGMPARPPIMGAPMPMPGQPPVGPGQPIVQPFNPQPLPPGMPLPFSPQRPLPGPPGQPILPRRSEGAISIPVPGKPPEPLPPGVPLSFSPQRPGPALAGMSAPFGITGPQPPGFGPQQPPQMPAPQNVGPQFPASSPPIVPRGTSAPAGPPLPVQNAGNIPKTQPIPQGAPGWYRNPQPQMPVQMPTQVRSAGMQYRKVIEEAANKAGVSPDIIAWQAQQENNWHPTRPNLSDSKRTGSPSFGLMQLQPGTAKQYGVKDVNDPMQNLKGGIAFMGDLTKKYGGDYSKALAGYNWGPANVDRTIKQFGDKWLDHAPKSTQSYVRGIMQNYEQSSMKGMGMQPATPVGDANRFSGIEGLGQSPSPAQTTQVERGRAGGKALDEAFAKEYATSINSIGDVPRQLANMRQVIANLSDPSKNLTGPVLGLMPDALLKFTNPEAVNTRQLLEEVVQRGLRPILGAQFTENEGERLIKRMYDPGLPEKDNLMRVQRLAAQMETAYANKVDAMKYFDQHGSLMGWQGKLPTIGDFEAIGTPGAKQPDIFNQADEILRGQR